MTVRGGGDVDDAKAQVVAVIEAMAGQINAIAYPALAVERLRRLKQEQLPVQPVSGEGDAVDGILGAAGRNTATEVCSADVCAAARAAGALPELEYYPSRVQRRWRQRSERHIR